MPDVDVGGMTMYWRCT